MKHLIELCPPDTRKIHSVPNLSGPEALQFENYEIGRMSKLGMNEPAKKEWEVPIVFVQKKGGVLTICLYNRNLKAITVRYSYQIPSMDDCNPSLCEAT